MISMRSAYLFNRLCSWSTLLCILPKELDCRFWKGHHLVAKIPLNAPGARFGPQPVFTGRNRPGRLWELWQQLVWFQNALTAVDFSYGDFGKSLKSREDWVFPLYVYLYIFTYLEPQTTSLNWMFGETTISYVKVWNHPIETTIYKWLFGVPGIYIYNMHAKESRGRQNGVFGAGRIHQSWEDKKNPFHTVDGVQKSGKLTSWGKGSWNPIIYQVLYIPSGCLGFLPSQQQGRSCILIKESTSNLHPQEVWQTADSSPLKSDRDPKGKRDRLPTIHFQGTFR